MNKQDNEPQQTPLFEKHFEVRWADCDANQHMRHSAYADFAAHTRVVFINHIGLDTNWLNTQNLGPILFEETTEYKREVQFGEKLKVTIEVVEQARSRKSFHIKQHIYKANGELSAVVHSVSGWLCLADRKVVELPSEITSMYPSD